MPTRPLDDRNSEEIATLVAELRSAAGCPTKRLSRGGHEFVLAKHTAETATEFAGTRELLWIAGATRVRTAHIEKLRTSAGAVDASRATVVTVGPGTVEPSLDEGVDHLAGDDLRTALRRTDGLSAPPAQASSETATDGSDSDTVSDAGSGAGWEPGSDQSAASAEADTVRAEQAHTRSGATESQSDSLVERVNAPLVIAETWNGTTTAHSNADSRAGHWQRTTCATTGSTTWDVLDGATIDCNDTAEE